MSPGLKPVTKAAMKRAEDADPNLQRCLVENCAATQAVQLGHVFDREASRKASIIESLEWNWNMKAGSLNLDTRHNMFFLGASLHELYKSKKWALLPPEDMVFRYFDEDRLCPLKRFQFPKIEEKSFKYTLLPLQDMDDIYVSRQSSGGGKDSVVIYDYPFETFPVMISHVHPKYVILHLGQILRVGLDRVAKKALMRTYPWLDEVQELFLLWTARLPDGALDVPGYILPTSKDEDPHLQTTLEASDNSPCTPPRGIQQIHPKHVAQKYPIHNRRPVPKSRVSRNGATHEADVNTRKANQKQQLTSKALRMNERNDDLKSVKWTMDQISCWAELCARPPSPPPPDSRPKSVLRRSARLNARINTS